jgi:hypothetical protein
VEEKYYIGAMADPMNMPDPPKFEVPSEFGSPTSNTKTVNVGKKLEKLKTVKKEDRIKSLLTDIGGVQPDAAESSRSCRRRSRYSSRRTTGRCPRRTLRL